MAEAIPILGKVVDHLLPLLIEKGKLLSGLPQEVKLISDEFGHMKAFLQNLENVDRDDDVQLTEWIRQVREASYEIEDVLDEFTYHYGNHHRPQGFRGCLQRSFKSTKNLPARHRLASKLEDLKARIKHISEGLDRYVNILSQAQKNLVRSNSWRKRRDDDAFLVEEDQLVGIDQPKRHLIYQLLDAEHSVKVIAVVGMGGLGKTTLVNKVYEDADVKSHFQIRAWVTVSLTIELNNILKDLIHQVLVLFKESIPEMIDAMDTRRLKVFLKESLQRGRYVIVFDDVWDLKFWNEFRFVLPENSDGGNRIVVTTRNLDVASASEMGFQRYVYKMEFLSPEGSWNLFCRRTFKDKNCPSHLKNIAESIVSKCEGLPLAIMTIGGLLAGKDSTNVHEWETVYQRLGDEFEGTRKLDRVKRILSLSYNDLPSALKSCLLYTSIYPEDHLIKCKPLINLWIGERLVEPKKRLTAEKVGWDYLKELANRSLIQFNEVRYNGLYNDFRIHDLLREMLVSKSRELNMVTVLSDTQIWQPDGKMMTRRLVCHPMNIAQMTFSPEVHSSFNTVRSIINCGATGSPSKALLTKLLSSKLLTVVDLRGIELEEFPEEVLKLFMLKFLAITAKIESVPKSIQKLQNLEFLLLDPALFLRDLPKEILKLHKLRCLWVRCQTFLNLPYNGFKTPCGLGKLVELQSIAVIDVSDNNKSGVLKEIEKLTKLCELEITNLRTEDGKELCSSLEKLHNLESLTVASPHGEMLDLNHPIFPSSLQSVFCLQLYGRLEKTPRWLSNLQRLERITLDWSNLKDDPLENLHHLPNLFAIDLVEAYQGESLCLKSGGFVKLRTLLLAKLEGLRSVRVEKNAMPGLKQLALSSLPLLDELPIGIENLTQLQSLKLEAMSSKLIKKLENAAGSEEEKSEESLKLSHIPEVSIWFIDHDEKKWKSRRLSQKMKSKESQHEMPK